MKHRFIYKGKILIVDSLPVIFQKESGEEIECFTQEDFNNAGFGEPSIGETKVRTKFNPSTLDTVDLLKQTTANLINTVEDLKPNATELLAEPNDAVRRLLSEKHRLASLAITAYEEAAMWAVKAATI